MRLEMSRTFVAASVLAIMSACGGSSSTDPVLTIGAYSIPVPSGWVNVSSESEAPGKVAIKTIQREPSVLVILSPAPDPMPFDPTESVQCDENGRRMGDLVGEPEVVALPAGKACAVKTRSGARFTSMVVLSAGGRGAMAQCIYAVERDAATCDAIFKRIKPTS